VMNEVECLTRYLARIECRYCGTAVYPRIDDNDTCPPAKGRGMFARIRNFRKRDRGRLAHMLGLQAYARR
jgi:hypothetical protein